MTNVTIRISTSATGPNKPATGIMGAFGGTVRGDLTDTNVEVMVEDLATMGDAVVAVEGIFPVASSAFLAAVHAVPTVHELAGDDKSPEESATNPWDETLIDAEVLDDVEAAAAEAAEKQRREAQRERAREIIRTYAIDGESATVDEDVEDAVRRLENEGIIR